MHRFSGKRLVSEMSAEPLWVAFCCGWLAVHMDVASRGVKNHSSGLRITASSSYYDGEIAARRCCFVKTFGVGNPTTTIIAPLFGVDDKSCINMFV